MSKNTAAKMPHRCEVHDLYYNGDRCWKCGPPSVEEPVRYEGEAASWGAPPESVKETLRALGIGAGQEPVQVLDGRAVCRSLCERFLQKSDQTAPSADKILSVCLDLAAFLMQKNKAYGDSALKPLRVVSKADAAEQIRVRIDDKLSRLFRGEAAGEDALQDIVGYWVLLQVVEAQNAGNGHA